VEYESILSGLRNALRQAEMLAEKKPERVWGAGWVYLDDGTDSEDEELAGEDPTTPSTVNTSNDELED